VSPPSKTRACLFEGGKRLPGARLSLVLLSVLSQCPCASPHYVAGHGPHSYGCGRGWRGFGGSPCRAWGGRGLMKSPQRGQPQRTRIPLSNPTESKRNGLNGGRIDTVASIPSTSVYASAPKSPSPVLDSESPRVSEKEDQLGKKDGDEEQNGASGRRRRMDETMFYFTEGESEEQAKTGKAGKNWRGGTSPDTIMIRTRKGKEMAIPQARRYSTGDWAKIMLSMAESKTLRRILVIVLANVGWAACVFLFHALVMPIATVQATAPGLLKSSLGYLLVFQTNSAYNRFWEGRQIWQRVMDQSRQLVRYAVLFRNELGEETVQKIVRLVRAFCLSLKHHVTRTDQRELEFIETSLLTKEEVDEFRSWKSAKPLYITWRLEKVIMQSPFNGIFRGEDRLTLFSKAQTMASTVAACERIVQTPIPLNYARHTSRLITLFSLLLPIALVGEIGWMVMPVSALVTWAFFAIQEIGLIIEEPFSSYLSALSLDVFCRSIFEDSQAQVRLHDGKAEHKTTTAITEETTQNLPSASTTAAG